MRINGRADFDWVVPSVFLFVRRGNNRGHCHETSWDLAGNFRATDLVHVGRGKRSDPDDVAEYELQNTSYLSFSGERDRT